MTRLLPVAFLVAVLLSVSASAARASEPPSQIAALVAALRDGGHVIYFRHAATDWGQQDRVQQAGDWTSCDPARIRQLSATGRAAARAVGEAMRLLAVPVGRVLASPYCRTRETAELLGLGPVETTTDVINMRVASYFGGRQAVIATARTLLGTPPAAGVNTVIVAHGNVVRDATTAYPGETEAVIFAPDGHGGFGYLGRVGPGDWQAMVAVDG